MTLIRLKQLIFISAISLLALSNAQAASLSNAETMAIKIEIKMLADSYGVYRDNLDAVGYAGLFAQDGKLVVHGNAVEGRAAIQARVEGAKKGSTSMHLMSTSHITVIDADTATGVHYAAVYGGETVESGAISVSGPGSVGKYTDKYTRTADGWRFAERSFSAIFTTTK